MDMTRDIDERLELFAGFPIDVHRIALNMDQVLKYQPPRNPAKVTDSRYKKYLAEFGPDSWELDALEPVVMTRLIEEIVIRYRDNEQWELDLERENEMREDLSGFAKKYEA